MTRLSNDSLRFVTRRGRLLALLAVAAVAAAGCEKALQVAPSSSVLMLSVPATSVPLNSAIPITVTATDTSGQPVSDGTLVSFTASLGQVSPPEVRVANGRATVTLQSGTTSGTATVKAVSGGVSSNTLTIRVGSLPERIVVSATTGASTATIVATVFDSAGNPVPGLPVTFATTSGTLGNPSVITDSLGQAVTSLFGTLDAVVTADYSGLKAAVAVRLATTGVLSLNVVMNPVKPLRRETVTFTGVATISGSTSVFPVRYEWQFSDGRVFSTTGNVISRAFDAEGIYWVQAVAFLADGSYGVSRLEFYVD